MIILQKKTLKNIIQISQKMLIVGGSGPGKTNQLLNLINHEPGIDRIYLYAKNLYEVKYQLLIKKKRKYRFKVFKYFKSFY